MEREKKIIVKKPKKNPKPTMPRKSSESHNDELSALLPSRLSPINEVDLSGYQPIDSDDLDLEVDLEVSTELFNSIVKVDSYL